MIKDVGRAHRSSLKSYSPLENLLPDKERPFVLLSQISLNLLGVIVPHCNKVEPAASFSEILGSVSTCGRSQSQVKFPSGFLR